MRFVLIALVLVSALVGVLGSIPVATPPSSSGPLGQATLTPSGGIASEHPNPPTPNGDAPEQVPIRRHRYRKKVVAQPPKEEEKYLPGTDFLGAYGGVPINPTAHLQASLKDDKEYVASILRAPVDLGDPTNCQHSDILKDEQELRRIALRINHRRVSLRQQQHWIDSATEALRKIETEIAQTTNTARNLAEEMDALTAQKEDITNHVKRAILLKELDRTSSNLMRLKDSRMQEEVELQKKHNKFALRNHEHNEILSKLHEMRTKHGLALGKLADPKPYRFAQQGLESKNEAQAETETETEAQAEGESEQQTESTEETQ